MGLWRCGGGPSADSYSYTHSSTPAAACQADLDLRPTPTADHVEHPAAASPDDVEGGPHSDTLAASQQLVRAPVLEQLCAA